MSTTLLPRSGAPRPRLTPPKGTTAPLLHRPAAAPVRILVATRGGLSDPALGVAEALAHRTGGEVRMLTVHQPRIPVPPGWRTSRDPRCESADRSLAAALLLRVRSQRRAQERAPRWPVRLEVGDPPRVIADVAAEERAQLVLVGLGREQPSDRVRGSHTASRLALLANAPVLAVAPRLRTLPRTALVLARTAAEENAVVRVLLPLLGGSARLWLARPAPAAPSAGERMARAAGCRVERVALTGDTVHDALALADRVGAEVVATPIMGGTLAQRAIERSAAVPLLSLSRRSVLVVPVRPPAAAPRATGRTHAAAASGDGPPTAGGG